MEETIEISIGLALFSFGGWYIRHQFKKAAEKKKETDLRINKMEQDIAIIKALSEQKAKNNGQF